MFGPVCLASLLVSGFLLGFQVLPCEFFFFLVCQFSQLIPGPSVCVSFSTVFSFLAYARSYSVCVSFSMFSHFSSHIPGPTQNIPHFSTFSVFLTIFQVLQCVCVSFFTFVSFLAIFQALQCTFLIFHLFQCFSLYSRSYHVNFSFSSYVIFLVIFKV